MSSSERWPLLDLGRPTPQDVEALRGARRAPAMTPGEYVRFLGAFTVSTETLRRRGGPRGPAPFSL
jgi:hypothetical protein